jgi:hypothetical protein
MPVTVNPNRAADLVRHGWLVSLKRLAGENFPSTGTLPSVFRVSPFRDLIQSRAQHGNVLPDDSQALIAELRARRRQPIGQRTEYHAHLVGKVCHHFEYLINRRQLATHLLIHHFLRIRSHTVEAIELGFFLALEDSRERFGG